MQIGFGELLLTLVIALVVLGPEKLPEAAQYFGETFAKLKNAWHKLQADVDLKENSDKPVTAELPGKENEQS